MAQRKARRLARQQAASQVENQEQQTQPTDAKSGCCCSDCSCKSKNLHKQIAPAKLFQTLKPQKMK